MRAATLVCAAATIFNVQVANALSIGTLEDFILRRESSDTSKAAALVFSTSLAAYYEGVAQILEALPGSDGRIVVGGKALICVPRPDVITKELVQALTESEIKRTDFYARNYGADWKSLSASVPIMLGLVRTYPCPE